MEMKINCVTGARGDLDGKEDEPTHHYEGHLEHLGRSHTRVRHAQGLHARGPARGQQATRGQLEPGGGRMGRRERGESHQAEAQAGGLPHSGAAHSVLWRGLDMAPAPESIPEVPTAK